MDLQERLDKVLAERKTARKALIDIAKALTPRDDMMAVEAGRCIEKAFSIAEDQKKAMPDVRYLFREKASPIST